VGGEAGEFLADVAAVGEEGDFLGHAFIGGIEGEAGVGEAFEQEFSLADGAVRCRGGERGGVFFEGGQAGEHVVAQMGSLGLAHGGEGFECGLECGFDGLPGIGGIDLGRSDIEDTRLAEIVGGGGFHQMPSGGGKRGECFTEGAGEWFVDLDGGRVTGGAGE
jgi:hypothetical protein